MCLCCGHHLCTGSTCFISIKKVKSCMARGLPVENLLPQNVGSIINYFSNLLKQPNVELLVAVDHNQLLTMASETVIVWSHPPLYTGQYPLSCTYCIVQCGLQITRLAALSEPRTCDLRNARPTHCLCGHSGYILNGTCPFVLQ